MAVLIAALGLMLAALGTAQTFTNLHSFTKTDPTSGANTDGANPAEGLILSSNIFYGTTILGGSSGNGTVFSVNTDGTSFTNLYSFTALDPTCGTNGDGAKPYGGLILSGNTLYGTTAYGGSSSNGTVFAVSIDGTGFTNLHNFTPSPYSTNSDGASPFAGLVLLHNMLYGTAERGGSSGNGTVFGVSTDSAVFTTLHSFTAIDPSFGTNSDGAGPNGLILSGNRLYGTAGFGGSLGYSSGGTVFAINVDGTGFTNLHNFAGYNIDGAHPNYSGFLLSGNTLYGTTGSGGSMGWGMIFAVSTNGTGYTNLHNFAYLTGFDPAGLTISSETLYGTTVYDGSMGSGTVFKVNTNGAGFGTLHSFKRLTGSLATNIDGAYPHGPLILSGNSLYGTVSGGGEFGNGTVFSLSFAPQLAITLFETTVILTWPTNFAGFDYTGYALQSTTNLSSPVWTTNSPAPVVVNGLNTVTNPISGEQQFFRLSQ